MTRLRNWWQDPHFPGMPTAVKWPDSSTTWASIQCIIQIHVNNTAWQKLRESYWIFGLRTLTPNGLNLDAQWAEPRRMTRCLERLLMHTHTHTHIKTATLRHDEEGQVGKNWYQSLHFQGMPIAVKWRDTCTTCTRGE